jgi:hypothetical protein
MRQVTGFSFAFEEKPKKQGPRKPNSQEKSIKGVIRAE